MLDMERDVDYGTNVAGLEPTVLTDREWSDLKGFHAKKTPKGEPMRFLYKRED
jgi:hypothetical protein